MGRGVDWAVQDVAQLRQWLEEGRAMRPDWSLESIKTKLKHLRRTKSLTVGSFFVGAGTCKRLESACLNIGTGNRL